MPTTRFRYLTGCLNVHTCIRRVQLQKRAPTKRLDGIFRRQQGVHPIVLSAEGPKVLRCRTPAACVRNALAATLLGPQHCGQPSAKVRRECVVTQDQNLAGERTDNISHKNSMLYRMRANPERRSGAVKYLPIVNYLRIDRFESIANYLRIDRKISRRTPNEEAAPS